MFEIFDNDITNNKVSYKVDLIKSIRKYTFPLIGQYKVAELLLQYGANRDCRTKSGITPFYQVR